MKNKEKIEKSAQKLPDSDYIKADISDELWRRVYLPGGTITIHRPVTLIMRKGGKTHRVVCEDGSVFCYVAPESGLSVIQWKTKDGKPPISF